MQVVGQTVISCPTCPVVTVTGGVDGDTIDTDIGRIRLYGVDTPERGERCFTEATEATRRLAGSQVRVEDGPRLTDRYDRRLAYVYDASCNSIDVRLVPNDVNPRNNVPVPSPPAGEGQDEGLGLEGPRCQASRTASRLWRDHPHLRLSRQGRGNVTRNNAARH